jgi:hypothetical protein
LSQESLQTRTCPDLDFHLAQAIFLTVYDPDGEVAVPLVSRRALELTHEILMRGVQAIKAYWPG